MEISEDRPQPICFFNSCKAWGGGEKWHFDTALRFSADGFPVVAGVYPGSELALHFHSTDIQKFEVRVSNLSFLNPWKIWHIRKRLQDLNVESIILNLPSDVKAAGIAARLAGVKKVIYRRGSAIPVRNSFLNRFLFRYVVNRVVANSHATKRSLLQRNSELIPEKNIQVIYNGIDLEAFDRLESLPLYRPPGEEVVLGTAGRLETQKNQKFMLEAARILKQRGLAFKLLIAGKGSLERELRQLASDLDLQAEVVFLGFVKNMRAFMASLDIFLLSSLWEGFGYVLIEAMACSKPVISLNNSNESEIVENDRTGFLVQQSDVKRYAEKILFLAQAPEIRIRFGRSGRERVERCFSMQRSIQELKDLIGRN
jgi:glycosyltransferase involved in cell wall biosynthesis